MQIHELNTFSGRPKTLDYLALDTGFDTAKISAEKLLEPKINRPTDEYDQYDNGTAGQLLRTKGDGSTEWADVGQPTDAQTAQAVSDWLDAHPEATTTVLDGSLTEAKFSAALKLKTIKEYITPQMFGALGDGATDDFQAFQDMFDYAENNQIFAVFIPEGTYIINGEIVVNSYISIYGTPGTILKAGSSATDSLIKYTFANYTSNQLVIDTIQLDGSNVATNGIFMTKSGGSAYLRNALFINIAEHDFNGHGFKFSCLYDSALYASRFRNCIFDSGLSLNKFGDSVIIDGCSFGRKSDNEFIQYTNASTFAFINNNVTGYCSFNLQLLALFENDIFELQVEPSKDFITIAHATESLIMINCTFSNQHRIADPSLIKLIKFTDYYLEFIGCTFTGNDAPDCYSAPNSLTSRFYGCVVSTGINTKDAVLANFNGRLFDICNGSYGTAPGFDVLNANSFIARNGLSLNNYIRMEAVNTLPATPADNTLYIVRSERRLCLSLTGGVVYQTDAMTVR